MLFVSTSLSCSHVKVKNFEFWADKGQRGAVNGWINGGPDRSLNKLQWDKARFGMACTEVSNLTMLLGVVKKLCFDTGRCTYEEYKQLEARVMRLYKKAGLDFAQAQFELDSMELLSSEPNPTDNEK